jgi:hypothetical protein
MEPFAEALAALIATYKNKYPKDLVRNACYYAVDLVEKDLEWLYGSEKPTATALSPDTAVAGDATDIVMTVTGTGFTESSVIWFAGHAEPTTFVSATEVSTGVKPSLFTVPDSCEVVVKTADGQASDPPLTFTFTAAARAARK